MSDWFLIDQVNLYIVKNGSFSCCRYQDASMKTYRELTGHVVWARDNSNVVANEAEWAQFKLEWYLYSMN